MQEPAKRFIFIMSTYNHEHLVSFGNYLLKTYGVKVHSNDGQNVPLYQREVTHADTENWGVEFLIEKPELKLPSQFQEGDVARYMIQPSGDNELFFCPCKVLAIHFYSGKVKYDLELYLADNTTTRIYNVDSCFVVPQP